jgi:DNA polymerase-3 subunit alpha
MKSIHDALPRSNKLKKTKKINKKYNALIKKSLPAPQNNNIMVLDIETTGIPQKQYKYGPYYDFKKSCKYDSSRIVQISWSIHTQNGLSVASNDFIVKPNNFIIPYSATEVHGISTEKALREGIDINNVFTILKNDIKTVKYIVAHCLYFDINVLLSELFREQKISMIYRINAFEKICTGEGTRQLLELPVNDKYITINGEYKMPKLSELYSWCFKKKITNEHNSKYDTENLVQIFFYLKRNFNLTNKNF